MDYYLAICDKKKEEAKPTLYTIKPSCLGVECCSPVLEEAKL
jgi:hypothetical protein